jgi:hypothetical protein
MPNFPARASFFTAHFAPASWLCHVLLQQFLLPTLRLRLGFAMCYSNKHTEIFIANCFYAFVIYDIMNEVASKKYKLIS